MSSKHDVVRRAADLNFREFLSSVQFADQVADSTGDEGLDDDDDENVGDHVLAPAAYWMIQAQMRGLPDDAAKGD